MEYTIENYKKSELPKIGDIVKIGQFTFSIEEGLESNKYYLDGMGCENDAAFCYVKENKYSFAHKVVEGYGKAFDYGTCPYISSLSGMAKLIKALWDAAETKENFLTEDSIIYIGPFKYAIRKNYKGFFLGLQNVGEVERIYGHTSRANDGIFRVLGLNKNDFFASATDAYGGYEPVLIDGDCSPYAKTIEGINEVISRLQEEYNRFVDDKKKHTRRAKTIAELEKEIPWNCDSNKNGSSKDINITIPKKSNPVKLKIIL